MNFWALKWLVENVVANYKCPECNSEINDSNIDVVWAAWTTVNIDIECSNCWKHSMIKSEVMTFDLSKMPLDEEKIEWLKKELWTLKWKLLINNWKKLIKDEEIVDLNKNLKKSNLNVSELFWDKQ